MAEVGKKSDRLREKGAQHTPPTCIREMGQASASTGRDQETPYASGGEGAGKPETRVELSEGSWQLHDPPRTPRCCCRGVLGTRNSHGAQTVTGSRNIRITKCGRPLRCGPHSSEEWRSCLCRTMRNGRGGAQKSHHLHSRNTSYPPGKGDVCGSVKSGDPAVSDAREVQKKSSPSMEDRQRMVLRIP